ncbi:NAD-dependent epimerase/dehydratase family protein [Actibacterium pelagium]|uniref:NAD-dependent dehydratase n=1 Tax=Actibacterium pelagium TaxID=2029103 RepID=A0A917EIG8_9RHOB|nr:NAD-dependent epimerase/dehydratase family protein [Actibacterium pelagium]GGE46664.1 NAD-dependent dehydratase [Actibacterium pelagium]
MPEQVTHFKDGEIVVAGGAGFVGAHLVRSLLKDGARVTVIDNFHTGTRASLSAQNRLQVIDHDVATPLDLPGPVSHVFNLACPASPAHYQADPISTWRTSVYGADHLAQFATDKGARLVQASTSEVYGDPLETPQRESYRGNTSTIGPRACYDEGKRAAESLLMDFHRVHGTQVRIARIFNTYGPGMAKNDGRVVSNFVVQALTGAPLTLFGDGSQTRSFCYVSDMVAGLKALASADNIDGEVINLGNPNEITVAELAALLGTLLEDGVEICHEPLPLDDPRRRRPDIGKAQRLLNWSPKVSLQEGLLHTIDDFRARLG